EAQVGRGDDEVAVAGAAAAAAESGIRAVEERLPMYRKLATGRTLIAVFVAALIVCGIAWNQTRREQLVLQAWSQKNGLHIKAVHGSWRWERGPFHIDWTGHSPLQRPWKGN